MEVNCSSVGEERLVWEDGGEWIDLCWYGF